jgi:Tol biopolymer transport system component
VRMKRKGRLLFVLGLVFLVQTGGIAWSQVTERVSVDTTGGEGNNASAAPSNSSDGNHVAFESQADNLVAGDGNGTADVFVHDRQTGTTTRVSLHTDGTEGNGESHSPSISGDGRYIAFESFADNLVAGDGNSFWDIFVHDLQTGITTRVSLHTDGTEGDGPSFDPSISSDGRYVAFESFATNLVADDNNGSADVFVHDRQTGATTRVSVDLAGVEGNGNSNNPSISADGKSVTFQSDADNLVAGDTNIAPDIFVDDLQAGAGEDEGGGDGNSGGGCFIATAAFESRMAGKK